MLGQPVNANRQVRLREFNVGLGDAQVREDVARTQRRMRSGHASIVTHANNRQRHDCGECWPAPDLQAPISQDVVHIGEGSSAGYT